MKRTLTLFLGLILSVPLFARDFTYTYEGQTITYTVLDESAKTCKVARNSNVSGELILPEHPMDGNVEYLLTELGGRAFYGCSGLILINIPNSVTTIGNEACRGCLSLANVVIGGSVTTIGREAFGYCHNLSSATIGNSVTTIENMAFYDCYNLKAAMFSDIESLCLIEFGDVSANPLYYAHNLYLGKKKVTEVTIPETITSLNYTFAGGSSLTSVEIPNSVTSIGNYAFYGCSGLTSVEIPNSVTSIGNNAFYGCSGLTSVDIPNSVTSIGNFIFYSCRGLTSVEISNLVTSIGNYAFSGCSGLASVEIPTSVTSIGNDAFYGCSGLTSVEIPNSVTSIGDSAFYGCSGLTSVEIPNSVISIGNSAFRSCSGLTSVEIPNLVTSIGNYTFDNCRGLVSVAIPNSVTTIGDCAFFACSKLTEIVIPPSVEIIGAKAFSETKLATVSIGYGIKSISTAFKGLTTIKDLYITATNPPVALFSSYNFPVWLVSEEAVDDYDIAIPYWDEFADKRVMTPVTGLSMPKVKVAGKPGDVVSLNVNVEPANASLQHLFYRTNRPDLISVDSKGNVTFLEQEGGVKALADAADCEITVTTMFENGPELKIDVAYGYDVTGVEDIDFGDTQCSQSNDIYNMQGVCIKRNASADDVKALAPGLYIVGGKKLLVK